METLGKGWKLMIEQIYNCSWIINDFFSNSLLFIIYFIILPQSRSKLNYVFSFTISSFFTWYDFSDLKYTDLGAIFIILLSILLIKSQNDLGIRLIMWNISLFLATFSQGFSSILIMKVIPPMINPKTATISIILFGLLTFLTYLFSFLILEILNLLNMRYDLKSFLYDHFIKKVILSSLIILNVFCQALDLLTRYLHIEKSYLVMTVIIISITVVLTTIGIIMLVSSHIKEIKTELQIEQMNERNDYINELEKNNDELRKFKHDYKNLLLSLSASINDNDDDNLKNSIGKLLNYRQINLTDNDNRANLYKLKDKLVKGILITKLMQAKNKHIKTNFEIDYNATIPSNSSVDTTRILGILLDNAIDACMETDNPELDFAMVSFDKYIELIVKNNVKSNSSINTNDIYKSGYSTKKNHPGLGLASVREIVDSNSKFMIQVQNKDGYYLTILTISKGK